MSNFKTRFVGEFFILLLSLMHMTVEKLSHLLNCNSLYCGPDNPVILLLMPLDDVYHMYL